MPVTAYRRLLLAGLAAPLVAAAAQVPGSVGADRARLAEIMGDSTHPRPRDPSRLEDWVGPIARNRVLSSFFVAEPSVRVTWNSNIPFSLNDGAMWAGRGSSISASAGLGLTRRIGHYDLLATVVPELLYSENTPFRLLPGRSPARSDFASPFHGPDASADLPLRFGDRYLVRVGPGRSRIELAGRVAVVGITAADEVWGPGIRNAIVLSANAPGIPRLYFATAQPAQTRLGRLDAKLMVGAATESFFFDDLPANDIRSISGALVSLKPRFDTTLTVGIARVVYAPVRGRVRGLLSRTFDVLTRWEAARDSANRSDQIASVFARWVFLEGGLEVYCEWARQELPRTWNEVLAESYRTSGRTFGLQWAQRKRRDDVLRLQAEVTNLEQARTAPRLRPSDFYVGLASPQGYTNRGQVIGAAIGPGGSSQWAALDYLTAGWQIGLFAGRIRWENDAMYREVAPTLFKHDVTLLSGLRGAVRTRPTDFSFEATWGHRFNYLFQNGFANFGGFRTIDVRNLTIALAATPR